jgi:hypothetical protein
LFGKAVHATTPFIRKRAKPNGGVGTAEERVNVLGFAGDGVEKFSGRRRSGRESSDDMDCLDKMVLMRTRIKVGASETGTGTAARAELGNELGENRGDRLGESRWNGRGENIRRWGRASEMGIMSVCHLYLFFFRKNMS